MTTTESRPERPLAPPEPKPGHLLPTVESEIDEFAQKTALMRSGELDATAFRQWRLSRGTYGQRQADNQMMRIKLCGGIVTADQMDALARIAREYTAINRGHLTTRENIQFHFVRLDDVPAILRILHDAGLTTREACSNVVRNVTGCPDAGVTDHEVFDSTPYLVAYARHMLRHPAAQSLPRKFKVSFSCGPKDCAGSLFHDIGFLPKERDGVRGFEIRAGGGTSTMPWSSHVVTEFATADDGEYLKWAEAIVRVFDAEGGETGLLRKNKNKARMKFLIKKVGAQRFNELVEQELRNDWAKQPLDMPTLTSMAPEGPIEAPAANAAQPPEGYARWRSTNVRPQVQPGYYLATVMVPIGNLSGEQLSGLAAIMRTYTGGSGRVNPNQNIVLRWVPKGALATVYTELAALGLGDAEAGLLADVVSCPGATSCSLAVTSSMSMGEALNDHMRTLGQGDPLVEEISIKISGCPNGCGQHHVAGIGLQGASMPGSSGATIPAYDVFVGGTNYAGATKYAERIGRVPAKRVPQALERLIDVYRAERTPDETFAQFSGNSGRASLKAALEPFQEATPLHQDLQLYIDYGSDQLFEVVRGEGECAV